MELIVFVESESSVCCVRIIQISVVIIKCLREGKPRVPGERMRKGGNSKAKEKKRKKKGRPQRRFLFYILLFFNFL